MPQRARVGLMTGEYWWLVAPSHRGMGSWPQAGRRVVAGREQFATFRCTSAPSRSWPVSSRCDRMLVGAFAPTTGAPHRPLSPCGSPPTRTHRSGSYWLIGRLNGTAATRRGTTCPNPVGRSRRCHTSTLVLRAQGRRQRPRRGRRWSRLGRSAAGGCTAACGPACQSRATTAGPARGGTRRRPPAAQYPRGT